MRWAGRWLRRALVLGLVLVVVVGWLAGWVTPVRPWEVSTGWEQIPQVQRAPLGTRLWPGKEAPRLHWLGHAGFLLDWAGTRLLLDPNESPWCTIAKRTLEPGRPPEELGVIDAVLVSHAHFDHLDLPTLRRLPRLGAVVLPMGSGRYVRDLEAKGTRVLDLAEGGSLQFGELEVVAVPARHNGNRWHPLTSHHGANGYVVRHGTEALYFAGDTGFGDHFTAIREAFHPRAAILPIGAYAPRFPMKYYHLSPEEAVAVLELEAFLGMNLYSRTGLWHCSD